jgi:solute carrier family 40 (iron-regulated transporter), member 1
MRRIDLFCKLLGPLFISLIDGFATKMAIFVTIGLSVASVGTEYWAIAQVASMSAWFKTLTDHIIRMQIYQKVPALQFSNIASNRERQNSQDSRVGETGQSQDISVAYFGSNLSDVKLYFRHRDFLPSMALSLLYLTVLSFAGQMVTYLSAVGYSSTQIGLIRTVSVVFEISATWLGPILMMRVGVIRAGLWSISWQLFCIAAAVALFWTVEKPFIAASGLIIGVVGSRVGLWVFDLCVQEIVQEVSILTYLLHVMS